MTGGLIEKVGAIHKALTAADLPHAFGGALALAWCVGDPRATMDVDINVFIAEADAALLRGALPSGIALSDSDIARLEEDGQVRAWWGETPVDIFLNSTPLHESAAARTRWERLGTHPPAVPELSRHGDLQGILQPHEGLVGPRRDANGRPTGFRSGSGNPGRLSGRKRRTRSSIGPSRKDGTRISAVTRLLAPHQLLQQHLVIHHLLAERFDHDIDDHPLEYEGRLVEIVNGGLTVPPDIEGFVDEVVLTERG